MKKWILGLLLVVGAFTSVQVQAAILLEPYAGYEMGKHEVTALGATTPDKTDFQAVAVGLRVGLRSAMGFWIAADGQYDMGKMTPPGGKDESATRTAAYGVLGVDLPIWFRIWGGYGFTNKVKDTTTNTELTGTSYKAGLGFTGLHIFSINVEYIKDDFKKMGASNIEDLYAKYDSSSILASISIPITF